MKRIATLFMVLLVMISNMQNFGGAISLATGELTVVSLTPYSLPGYNAVVGVTFNELVNPSGQNILNVEKTDTYIQNNILINGKSMFDIHSSSPSESFWFNYQSGVLFLYVTNGANDKLKLDGTDTITFKSGYTTPAGDTLASDITFTYSGTTWSNGNFIKDLSISSVKPLIIGGYQAFLELTFNNPANEGGNLINLQDSDVYVQNNILINGKTIKQICATGAPETQVWVNYVNGGKMDIWILNSCTEKLKLDGTDTITFKSGFAIPLGHSFASDTILTYNGTTWILKDLKISSLSSNSVDGYQSTLEVAFNIPTNTGENLINLQDTDANVQDNILINGKSIKEICALGELDKQVLVNYVNKKMNILVLDTCTEKLKLDGTDTITFKSGFSIPTGHIFASDITLNFDKTTWVLNDLNIYTVTPILDGACQSAFEVEFNNSANIGEDLINLQDTDAYVQNNILINGKSIGEISSSGYENEILVNYINGKIDILILNSFAENLKLDGTDTITFESGFVTPTGRAFTKDTTLAYNGSIWVIKDLDISVIAPNSTGAYQSSLQVTFNHPANVEGNLNNLQDTDDYVQNYILINGKSVKDICNTGEVETQILINYVKEKMDIFILNSCTEKLKLDGTDTITFMSGFATPTGRAFASDITLTYNVSIWAVKDLSISTVKPFVFPDHQAVIELFFNKSANLDGNLINLQDTDTYVKNYILINGKLVKDICSSGELGKQIWVNYVGGKMDIWILNSCTEKFKLDGTDTIVLKKGFVTPTGHMLDSDVTLTYSGTTWIIGNIIKDLAVTSISEVVVSPVGLEPYPDWQTFKITFNNAANVGLNAGVESSDLYIRNNILINGKSIEDINANDPIRKKDGADIIVGCPAVQTNYVNGQLYVYIFTNAKNKLNLNGNDTITIKSGFTTPSGHSLVEDLTYKYNTTNEYWYNNSEELNIQTLPIHVVDVSTFTITPLVDKENNNALYNNVSFDILFDNPITYRTMPHVNAPTSWLQAISAQDSPPFSYSDIELDSLRKYGIYSSILDNILFNGNSIRKLMQAETNANLLPITVMVHLGQANQSTLSITMVGNGVNKITTEMMQKGLSLEIKHGMLTPSGGETTDDTMYYFDNNSQTWYLNEIPKNISTINTGTTLPPQPELISDQVGTDLNENENQSSSNNQGNKDTNSSDQTSSTPSDNGGNVKIIHKLSPLGIAVFYGGPVILIVLICTAVFIIIKKKKRKNKSSDIA